MLLLMFLHQLGLESRFLLIRTLTIESGGLIVSAILESTAINIKTWVTNSRVITYMIHTMTHVWCCYC